MNFLDRFEGIVLNKARHVITSLILLAIVVAGLYFAMAVSNFADSPSVEASDSFNMPEFVKPQEEKVAEKAQAPAATNSETQAEAKAEEKQHPLPRYADEIDEVVKEVLPLYIAYYDFKDDEDSRWQLISFIADLMEKYQAKLYDDQMDEAVKGFVSYMDDFADYYKEKSGIARKPLDQITSLNNPEIKKILGNPFNVYFRGVMKNYEILEEEAQRAKLESQMNNASALQQIMVTGGALAAMVLLILLLIIFKIENSLRRTADVAEGYSPQ